MPSDLAKIIAHSYNPAADAEIVTWEIRLWKPLQAELNTHRTLSRNSASSRAIPSRKLRAQVLASPFVPGFLSNKPGMQGGAPLFGLRLALARGVWRALSIAAVAGNKAMDAAGVHKQTANRLLEPWLEIPVVVTATEFRGVFAQRCHADAQPELRAVADAMREAWQASTPAVVHPGGWHLPYMQPVELIGKPDYLHACCSAARCARVSYRLLDGRPTTMADDLDLFRRLVVREPGDNSPPHWSPLEHPARALHRRDRVGNFLGWHQLRKDYAGESFGDNEEVRV